MSEHMPQSPERRVAGLESVAEHVEVHEHKHSHEKEPRNKEDLNNTLENIRSTVKHESVSAKEVGVDKALENPAHESSPLVNKELKKLMFKRTLTQVQKQLSAPSRVFSKITHSTAVDSVSSAAEKTVARPKGFLVGSILAFAGSAYTYYSAKQNGFEYNVLLFFILFVAGYAVTTLVELATSKLRR